jgi:hypothetical protein
MSEYRIRREAQNLERYIEELLRLWGEAQDMQRQLDEFGDKYEAPEAPEKFDSVLAMLDYVERKQRYDQQLQGASNRALEYRRNFERKSMQLREYFPEDVPLMYTYQSYGGSHVGVGDTFEIVKVISEEQPSIRIRKLDGED